MKKILLVSHCVPYPPDKGERLRAFHIVNVLGRFFDLSLLCFSRNNEKVDIRILRQYCSRVKVINVGWVGGMARGLQRLMKGDSLTQGFYDLKKARQAIHRWGYFDVAAGYSVQMYRYIKHATAEIKIMDLVDIDSLKWDQYSQLSGKPLSWFYRREARAVNNLEKAAISTLDASVVISGKEAINAPVHGTKLHVIPNGVDSVYFHPTAPSVSHKYAIIFVGTMNYPPNVQAVLWFVEKVWPKVKKQFPSAVFKIVGRNPTRAVRKLGLIDGIEVTGAVNDVRPYLQSASVAVAPLKIARGMQNKILESMAMGVATIASSQALDGLGFVGGVEVIEAQSESQWQNAVLGLFRDTNYHKQIASAGRQAVVERYNWSSFETALSELIHKLLDNKTPDVASAGTYVGSDRINARTGRR